MQRKTTVTNDEPSDSNAPVKPPNKGPAHGERREDEDWATEPLAKPTSIPTIEEVIRIESHV
jgi:hypothetical protein